MMVQKISPQRSPRRNERDGQEFGLVPKYVLRKKKTVSKEQAQRTAPASNDPGSSNNNSGNNGNINNTNGPMMKDSDEEDIPRVTPEQASKLLHETNSLLARRWGLSSMIDSENDKKLLLATEAYQPSKAANRIEKNCKTKMELFGSELIDKKITLFEDLSPRDENIENIIKNTDYYDTPETIHIEDGYVQLLPTRDLAGRAVLFFKYDADLYAKEPDSFRKILFYMMASALEDEDTARRGVSMVVWNGAPTKWFDPFWRAFEKISAPFKISKLHYCQVSHYDSSYQVLEKRERGETDVRIHKGSLQECMHGLVTYGVPSHFIPLDALSNGSIDLRAHTKWIALRRRIESFPVYQQAAIVLVPGEDDVLLGKRQMSMNGNVLYHEMIMKHLKVYNDAASEETREDILMTVWDFIRSRGGRFLLQVEDGQLWEKLELKQALYKIRQAFDFLCVQLFTPRPSSSKDDIRDDAKDDEDDFFFAWNDLFDGKKCFDLIHAKDGFGKKPICW
mmetsp:Transcript_993/g.2121  ORF Transcript_993/g.2121 Transcript_993/m.2121 type:complete len:507 (-) Transcript_993:77-1597(-)